MPSDSTSFRIPFEQLAQVADRLEDRRRRTARVHAAQIASARDEGVLAGDAEARLAAESAALRDRFVAAVETLFAVAASPQAARIARAIGRDRLSLGMNGERETSLIVSPAPAINFPMRYLASGCGIQTVAEALSMFRSDHARKAVVDAVTSGDAWRAIERLIEHADIEGALLREAREAGRTAAADRRQS